MTYHCHRCARRLELYEESFPADRLFMWMTLHAQDDICFHAGHAGEVVETCLSCNPPQELTAA